MKKIKTSVRRMLMGDRWDCTKQAALRKEGEMILCDNKEWVEDDEDWWLLPRTKDQDGL